MAPWIFLNLILFVVISLTTSAPLGLNKNVTLSSLHSATVKTNFVEELPKGTLEKEHDSLSPVVALDTAKNETSQTNRSEVFPVTLEQDKIVNAIPNEDVPRYSYYSWDEDVPVDEVSYKSSLTDDDEYIGYDDHHTSSTNRNSHSSASLSNKKYSSAVNPGGLEHGYSSSRSNRDKRSISSDELVHLVDSISASDSISDEQAPEVFKYLQEASLGNQPAGLTFSYSDLDHEEEMYPELTRDTAIISPETHERGLEMTYGWPTTFVSHMPFQQEKPVVTNVLDNEGTTSKSDGQGDETEETEKLYDLSNYLNDFTERNGLWK